MQKAGPNHQRFGPAFLSLNVLLIQRLEAHTAHATHVRCTGVAACACGFRLISNDCLGGQEQTSDGSRVLQSGTGDLDRIGNAGSQKVLVCNGSGVQAVTSYETAIVLD